MKPAALLIAFLAAPAFAQDAAPLECAGLDALVSWGLVPQEEAAALSTLARSGDAATCEAELEARSLPGLDDRACRAALARILDHGVPPSDRAGAPFEDPSLVLPLVLSGENPITCAALANAP